MGGYGSGRRPGKKKQDILPYVDLRLLRRKGALADGCVSVLQWFRKSRYIGEVQVTVAEDQIILEYQAQIPTQHITQSVNLTYTPCYFGGVRPWMLCPGCHRRVLILYAGSTCFRCRHCFKLTYSSRNEGKLDLLLRRIWKVRSKLGTTADLTVPIAPRPKGMHHTTYDQLWWKAITNQQKLFKLMEENIQKIHNRIIS